MFQGILITNQNSFFFYQSIAIVYMCYLECIMWYNMQYHVFARLRLIYRHAAAPQSPFSSTICKSRKLVAENAAQGWVMIIYRALSPSQRLYNIVRS